MMEVSGVSSASVALKLLTGLTADKGPASASQPKGLQPAMPSLSAATSAVLLKMQEMARGYGFDTAVIRQEDPYDFMPFETKVLGSLMKYREDDPEFMTAVHNGTLEIYRPQDLWGDEGGIYVIDFIEQGSIAGGTAVIDIPSGWRQQMDEAGIRWVVGHVGASPFVARWPRAG